MSNAFDYAPGHYDGDGCTFPTIGHIVRVQACQHPAEFITWKYKGPGKTVTIIDGMLHGTCDACGADTYRAATFHQLAADAVQEALPGVAVYPDIPSN